MPERGAADVAVVDPQAKGGLVLDGGGLLRGSHGLLAQRLLFGVVAKEESMSRVTVVFTYTRPRCSA